jgi:mannose-6-phosphate isomerase-like protein (cupin superfamily)
VSWDMSDFTIENLAEVEDSAVKFGFSETQESRFPQKALGAESTGLAFHRIKPGKRQAFGHKHDEAEEVYVVLNGSGRIKLGDEVHDLQPLDAVRIAPSVPRSLEGGPEGLELIAFGPHHDGDGELLKDFWPNE